MHCIRLLILALFIIGSTSGATTAQASEEPAKASETKAPEAKPKAPAAKESPKKAEAKKPAKTEALPRFATLHTSLGKIKVELYGEKAPETVANFVGLAQGTKEFADPETGKPTRRKFYDGTIFHRVIPNFMIQGGDPLGNGRGGPGYEFKNEYSDLRFDQPGRLAMANRGPNTNGSQFFITTAVTPHLGNGYTIFGQVVQGQTVADKIAALPRDRSDRPNTPPVIERIEFSAK
jgi:peptidyl-prolyl cis-trans isomerase A (cyclophilin A)